MNALPASPLDLPPVAAALRAAFAEVPVTLVGPVTGGLSGARLFRLGAESRSWLLRLDAGGDMFRDPARWQPCMRIAAAAGLAPEVRYTDAQHGVSITAFVEGRTLAAGPQGPREAMISALGDLVRRLQATEPFPPLVDYMDGMAALLGQLRAGGLLAPDALEAELAGYRRLDAAYRALRPELASSHNDLNPRNILQDGARLWVVDWESAFLADRYMDLASLANAVIRDAAELAVLTQAYFGRPPTPTEAARLFLAQQVNHVLYGVMFLLGLAAERPGARIVLPASVPELPAIHQALALGRFDLESWEGCLSYGVARLRAARSHLAGPRFAQAVRLAR